jgi:hypothetical protein
MIWVPEPEDAVEAEKCDPSVVEHRDACDCSFEGEFLEPLGGVEIPHRHAAVLGARYDSPPVRKCLESVGAALMARLRQRLELTSCFGVPHAEGEIFSRSYDATTVGRYRDRRQIEVRRNPDLVQRCARVEIPSPEGTVAPRGDRPATVPRQRNGSDPAGMTRERA